ncbi:MAG: beta-propeller domain-containing protein, partial [Actinomycetota bacterium]
PVAGVDYSTTTIQEEGVDEPDIVKSDGRRMYTVAAGAIQAVDVRGGGARRVGRLPLDGQWGAQLLLSGDRLLVIANGVVAPPPVPVPTPEPAPAPGTVAPSSPAVDVMPIPSYAPPDTVVSLVDVSDPGAMRVVETLRLEGSFVSARLTGRTVRLVVTTPPDTLPLEAPRADGIVAEWVATARNREVVARAPLSTWLPTYRVEKAGRVSRSRPLVACADVRRPPRFAGLGTLTVTTLDVARGVTPVDSDAVATDGSIVYGSQGSLYVATTRWIDPAARAAEDPPAGVATEIHRFDTSRPEATAYRGSGRVTGFLLSQWAMSEKDGVLRVASTREPDWWTSADDESESYVTTLAARDAGLVPVARVGGLGRGERIRAVRFIGDAGYVVTFRQTDPLYVVDLSDPARPRVAGELKIPGYSAYLHPVGDGLLLGVGQDATDTGRVLGTQLSLFDVSDPSRPRRLHHVTVPGAWSEAEEDHHAFLYWPATGLAMVPLQGPGAPDGTWRSEAVGFRVDARSGIVRVGAVTHPAPSPAPIRRSLVAGPSVYTVSETGVKASGLQDLADRAWLGF